MKLKTPFILPPALLAAYYLVFGLVMASFFVRSNGDFWASLPILGGWEIGTHMSNFALSYAILSGACLPAILMGKPFRNILVIAGLLAAANISYELLLPFLNTRDMIDAIYGLAGTGLGLGALWLAQKYRCPASKVK